MEPTMMVISNWLKLPIMVIKTPFQGLAFLMMNTRPNHSPTRLGVKMLTDIPDKTASNDFKKEIRSTLLIRNCHLSDSIPQLTSIKATVQIMSKITCGL